MDAHSRCRLGWVGNWGQDGRLSHHGAFVSRTISGELHLGRAGDGLYYVLSEMDWARLDGLRHACEENLGFVGLPIPKSKRQLKSTPHYPKTLCLYVAFRDS
jgi:hypothetical protein